MFTSHRSSRALLASAGAIALLLFAAPAHAGPLTFRFTGTVDSIFDPPGSNRPAPWNGVQVGDLWTLTYTFETSTADTDPSAAVGSYIGAILSYDLTVGPASENALSVSEIRIFNDFPSGVDQYEVFIFPPGIGAEPNFFFQLDDSTNSSWSTDALPTNLNLAGFNVKNFNIEGSGSPRWQINGQIETFAVIPEPSGALMLLAGAGIAMRRRAPVHPGARRLRPAVA